MSSVSGLKDSPHNAIRFPERFPSKYLINLLKRILFWELLTSSTALSTRMEYPFLSAVFMRAFTSLGKQEPPYPQPGYRNLLPIRESAPIPLRTIFTFAPTNSQRFAISFIKLIRVANIEFAAYFIISAEGISVKIKR